MGRAEEESESRPGAEVGGKMISVVEWLLHVQHVMPMLCERTVFFARCRLLYACAAANGILKNDDVALLLFLCSSFMLAIGGSMPFWDALIIQPLSNAK